MFSLGLLFLTKFGVGQELEGVEKTNMQVPQLIMKLTGQSNNLQTIAGQVAANAPKSQEDLGVAVESFSKLVSDICDTTLQVVEKQGDTEVQQNMINAGKPSFLSPSFPLFRLDDAPGVHQHVCSMN